MTSTTQPLHSDFYTNKTNTFHIDRPVDTDFAKPAAAANGTLYKLGPMVDDPVSTTDSLVYEGTQASSDFSPPVTPVPIKNRSPNTSSDLHTKRSFTTSVVPANIPTPSSLEEELQEESSQLKRHSTLHSVKDNDSILNESGGRSLARHHTTGHASKKKPKPEIGISEEFAKELSARRRAFKRLSRRQEDFDDDRVMVGTRVDKDHRDYVLMYNMLTGIRIAVGRVSAKANRPVTDEDFAAAHKLAFNVTGDELTPGAKYDFKFKDYAPWAFRQLREQFGIDPADYLVSLTSKYILSELGSPGKSGSFFYYSRDYRFIIKTIHHSEHKYLRKILKDYHAHVMSNPDTLLCRYYGLHRVKQPRGRKIHFVVMGNVFPPNKDIHETYDLKGSLVGRLLPEEEIKKSKNAVMKDLNFQKNNRKLQMGPQKRKLFIGQLMRDVKLLVRLNIMDYSLLIGIHNLVRGNKDNIRDSTLQFFQPDTKRAERHASMLKRRQTKAQVVRKAIAQTNPERLDSSKLPEDPHERRNCIFYSDEGGFRSTDEHDRPTSALYYMGIIDILTPYDSKKKSEHFFKSMTQDKHAISAVEPLEYGNRFMGFMAKTLEYHNDIPHEYQMGPEHRRRLHF
ncbi:SAICAR synthase-like protein [Lichtheimia hyalospora FSU 10163]|nr:SAICAR synthase-like protein [Lichtheimia hyalospora FSU 10163]